MKKLILSIETSSDICGVSLFENGNEIDTLESFNKKKHAELLPNYVKSIMKNNRLDLINIDGISISIGPGSFTGLRVGLSFAKGISYAIKCPIIPVPTILSLAYSLKEKRPSSGIIKSHGDKIFFQEFIWDKKIPSIKNKPILGSIKDYQHKLKNSFHYNCESILGNTDLFYKTKPSSIHIGYLSFLYYDNWINDKPYNLVSEYIYPYKIKINNKKYINKIK